MQILVEFITNSPESKQTEVKLAVKFPPAPSCVLSASNKKLSCLEIHSLLQTALRLHNHLQKLMSKINSETLLSGDYLLLHKYSN